MFVQDRSNCLIEAAKGGHTEIVKLLLEYPKSVSQRPALPTTTEPSTTDDAEGEDRRTTTALPNCLLGLFRSFACASGTHANLFADNKRSAQTPNSPIQLLKSLQKIVPRNILDVLQTGVSEATKSPTESENKGLLD